ncbi:response regulator transcription factor [Roseibium suaedae]|uniref:DNA-binding response regulator, OmpR family, contains REC and winged-helix (WHTH) domain n=1 Tax=Roseibium suaedae TaxID=735517 RepID=A0A1M7IZU8_9HYPH|nr:response regulator transcription factor [Roseibium suaedae]SHM46198.1 DNA-binding response regulator, OmpR family, contains REC and winged-helix (wHTH) domain [Roseibium suaedae]
MNRPDSHQDKTISRDHLVYVVDDEPDICALLSEAMRPFAIKARPFSRARDLLDALTQGVPDAVLVDLGLPDMEGMTLINEIRKQSSVPIIVLSARNHSSDRVMGLELGADDYVVKPFDPREVVARIRSILRRAGETLPEKTDTACARFEGWSYRPSSHSLTSPDGEETYLSTGEATLLDALLRAPRRVLTRDYLLEHGGRDESMDRSIDVRISRIRKKLSAPGVPSLIRTIYGSGYMLTASVDWS